MIFSIAINLNPIEKGVILFAGAGFLIMFGYSSVKGGYQELIKTTLDNDENKRKSKPHSFRISAET